RQNPLGAPFGSRSAYFRPRQASSTSLSAASTSVDFAKAAFLAPFFVSGGRPFTTRLASFVGVFFAVCGAFLGASGAFLLASGAATLAASTFFTMPTPGTTEYRNGHGDSRPRTSSWCSSAATESLGFMGYWRARR